MKFYSLWFEQLQSQFFFLIFLLFSVTALLVGEKLPPEAEIEVGSQFCKIYIYILNCNIASLTKVFCFLNLRLLTLFDYSAQNDPFKLKTGGIVDMKKVKDRNRDM